MLRCCIKNCDTDENVVNCTSVFFVGFPSEMSLRAQWLNILSANGCLPEEEITVGTKLCSCHFVEESFGKHPVHGYRFLLPEAVPSIFPLAVEELMTASELGFDTGIDALFGGAVIEDIFQQDELQGVVSEVDSLISEDEVAESSASVLSEPAKTIGIQYADGKYYFLQSDDETDDELVERDSLIEEEPSALDQTLVAEGSIDDVSMIAEEGECEMIYKEETSQSDTQVIEDDVQTEVDSLITTTDSIDEEGLAVFHEAKGGVDEQGEYYIEFLQAFEDDESVRSDECIVEMIDVEAKPRTRRKPQVNKHFCDTCSKGFPYESGLKKHLLVHNGLKPHHCATCGKSFSQKVNLAIHMRRHTGEEALKKFTCEICNKKCIRMSELVIHMRTHHRKLPHGCDLCPDRFSDITNYYEHLKSRHRDELTQQESIDLIARSKNAELIWPGDDEQMPQDDDELFSCTICMRCFKSERLLRKHKRKMHPKVFVCGHCPKQFLYRSLLEKHSRVHTLEKPFQCTFCELSFSQKANLEAHLAKIHKIAVNNYGRKYLECSYCQKKFDRPSSLQVHIRTHTRERPFGCGHCPKAFASNSLLAAHIRTHHSGQSILRQPAQRKSMAVNSTPEEPSISENLEENVGDEDTKFVQYSIQIINAAEQAEIF